MALVPILLVFIALFRSGTCRELGCGCVSVVCKNRQQLYHLKVYTSVTTNYLNSISLSDCCFFIALFRFAVGLHQFVYRTVRKTTTLLRLTLNDQICTVNGGVNSVNTLSLASWPLQTSEYLSNDSKVRNSRNLKGFPLRLTDYSSKPLRTQFYVHKLVDYVHRFLVTVMTHLCTSVHNVCALPTGSQVIAQVSVVRLLTQALITTPTPGRRGSPSASPVVLLRTGSLLSSPVVLLYTCVRSGQ
jgi:hypothetical protein